jgi:hypothetical protein
LKRTTPLIRGKTTPYPLLIRGNKKEGVHNNSPLTKGDKGGCKRTKNDSEQVEMVERWESNQNPIKF